MTNFKEWVAEMVVRIDYKRFNTYRPANNDTNIVFCFDNRTGKVGVARCNPSDNFNLDVGKAIAYARCKGLEIPKQGTYKKLSEMKNGDIFLSKYNDKLLFVGKCVDYYEVKVYAVQNLSSNLKTLFIMTDSGKEFEMVE